MHGISLKYPSLMTFNFKVSMGWLAFHLYFIDFSESITIAIQGTLSFHRIITQYSMYVADQNMHSLQTANLQLE